MGAAGDGVTDDTATIQAAITAAGAGGTVFFPPTSAFYLISPGSLTVTTANLRMLGTPRDGYAVSIRAASGTGSVLTVKAAGFTFQDIGIIGNGGVNGVGATMDGIDLFGDSSANCDATIGGTLQGLAQAVKIRGRNADCSGALVSNSLNGVQLDGIDVAYHTGPDTAAGNRGNTIRLSRFHNIGTSAANKMLEITDTAKVAHAVIEGNYLDSSGLARHVVITGTAANVHSRLSIRDMKHTETGADVYDLTYLINSTIDGVDMAGDTSVSPGYGRGIVLNNCTDLEISNVFGIQLGQTGAYGRNNTRIRFRGVKWRALGGDPGTVAHGFDFDATNTGIEYDNIAVETTDGWGILGSPVDSKMGAYNLRNCTLGDISSTTLARESVFIGADAIGAITATANLANLPGVGYPSSWQLDASVVEQVSAMASRLPNHWGTFNIVLWWAAVNANAGNVLWALSWGAMTTGATPAAGMTGTVNAAPAAAPGVGGQVVTTTLASGVVCPTGPLIMRIQRVASDAADTYVNDVALIGVQLIRVT